MKHSVFSLLPASLTRQRFHCLRRTLTAKRLRVCRRRLPFNSHLRSRRIQIVGDNRSRILFVVHSVDSHGSVRHRLRSLGRSLRRGITSHATRLRTESTRVHTVITTVPSLLIQIAQRKRYISYLPSQLMSVATRRGTPAIKGQPALSSCTPNSCLNLITPPHPSTLTHTVTANAIRVCRRRARRKNRALCRRMQLTTVDPSRTLVVIQGVATHGRARLTLRTDRTRFHHLTRGVPTTVFHCQLCASNHSTFACVDPCVRALCKIAPRTTLTSAITLFDQICPSSVPTLLTTVRTSTGALTPFCSRRHVATLSNALG